MGWSRASHFSHVSASPPGGSASVAILDNALQQWRVGHGLAGWCFRRLPETGAGLWADDGGNPLPHARSSVAAANLCLAELRSVSEFSRTGGISCILAG